MMERWLYEVREINTEWVSTSQKEIPDSKEIIEGYLNGMDEAGWELIGFLPILPGSYFDDFKPNPFVVHAVFRQPRTDELSND